MTTLLLPDGDDLGDEAVEALLSGSAGTDTPLGSALAALRRETPDEAPEPSAELAALFASGGSGGSGGFAGDAVPDELATRRGRRAGGVALAVIAAGATLTVSGVAAAEDALPGPVQRVVTGIVNHTTPFTIRPRHTAHLPGRPPSHRPSPTDVPIGDRIPAVPGSSAGSSGGSGTDDGSGHSDRPGHHDGRLGHGPDGREHDGGRDRSSAGGGHRSGQAAAASHGGSGRSGYGGAGDRSGDGGSRGDHSGDGGSTHGRSGSGGSGGSGRSGSGGSHSADGSHGAGGSHGGRSGGGQVDD